MHAAGQTEMISRIKFPTIGGLKSQGQSWTERTGVEIMLTNVTA
jgi:hypothetical protein